MRARVTPPGGRRGAKASERTSYQRTPTTVPSATSTSMQPSKRTLALQAPWARVLAGPNHAEAVRVRARDERGPPHRDGRNRRLRLRLLSEADVGQGTTSRGWFGGRPQRHELRDAPVDGEGVVGLVVPRRQQPAAGAGVDGEANDLGGGRLSQLPDGNAQPDALPRAAFFVVRQERGRRAAPRSTQAGEVAGVRRERNDVRVALRASELEAGQTGRGGHTRGRGSRPSRQEVPFGGGALGGRGQGGLFFWAGWRSPPLKGAGGACLQELPRRQPTAGTKVFVYGERGQGPRDSAGAIRGRRAARAPLQGREGLLVAPAKEVLLPPPSPPPSGAEWSSIFAGGRLAQRRGPAGES